MSVSRFAGPPHFGQSTLTQSVARRQRRGSLGGQIGARQVRQLHRQLIVGHRHLATALAVDDRDRAAPVALPAQQPVPQSEGHCTLADAFGLQLGDDRANAGLLVGQTVQDAGVDVAAVSGRRDAGGRRICLPGGDHLATGSSKARAKSRSR